MAKLHAEVQGMAVSTEEVGMSLRLRRSFRLASVVAWSFVVFYGSSPLWLRIMGGVGLMLVVLAAIETGIDREFFEPE